MNWSSAAFLSVFLLAAPAGAQSRGARGVLLGEPEGLAEIRARLAGSTGRRAEARILELLGDASDRDLDAMVSQLDLRRLLRDVDDRLAGPDNYTRLLNLLARARLGALSVPSRAALVDALQRGATRPAEERAIGDILLGTRGEALSELKNRIDRGRDPRDLHRLIHEDIDDVALRARLLDHFLCEGRPTGRVRVVSDIDDTVLASHNDERFPSRMVYPGYLRFMAELGGGGGHPVFLSARFPKIAGVIDLEQRTLDMLHARGVPEPVMLSTGTLTNHLLRRHRAMARRKRARFDEYRALFPEYDFVFVGDSGQGDATFALEALRDDPRSLQLALIHDLGGVGEARRRAWREGGLETFETYVGAARIAHQRGLLDRAALIRITRSALADLAAASSLFKSHEQRARIRALLSRDVEAVNALLPKSERVQGQ